MLLGFAIVARLMDWQSSTPAVTDQTTSCALLVISAIKNVRAEVRGGDKTLGERSNIMVEEHEFFLLCGHIFNQKADRYQVDGIPLMPVVESIPDSVSAR